MSFTQSKFELKVATNLENFLGKLSDHLFGNFHLKAMPIY